MSTHVDPSKHYKLIHYWAYRYGAQNPVEDSEEYAEACEAFAVAYKYFRTGKGANFCTFASNMICRRLSNYRKRKYKRQSKLVTLTDLRLFASGIPTHDKHVFDIDALYPTSTSLEVQSKEPDPFDACSIDLDKAKLVPLLSKLSTRQQELIRLKFYEGMSYVQIGKCWNISGKRVGQICRSALNKLKVEMK